MIILSRLAGADEYGKYLLIFAWALVFYGLAAQWMRYAYFGTFKPDQIKKYIGSLYSLLVLSMLFVGVIIITIGALGVFSWVCLAATISVICGLAVYEIAFEVARTLLDATATAASIILRSILTLAFGAASLSVGGGAIGLAFAIGGAHVVAALPSLAASRPFRDLQFSRNVAVNIVTYGWPLLLSFGAYSAGTVVDRFVIAHQVGTPALASYGVVSDLMRQSFSVIGEIIILSLVTIAKHYANEGDSVRADEILRIAFNATLAAALLGAAFYIVFGPAVVAVAFAPEFVAPIERLIPILAIRSAVLVITTYYFAQVIYFADKAYIDLFVAIGSLVLSTVLLLLFVPAYGVGGAVISMTIATIFSFLIYVWLGRKLYRLPIDFTGAAQIFLLTGVFLVFAYFVFDIGSVGTISLVINAAIYAFICFFIVYRCGFLTVKWPHPVKNYSIVSG